MFREMRRRNQQLSKDACEKILQTAPRGVLAVLGDGGYPYTVPLDFVYEDGRIYFHSAVTGHKLDAIKASDKCSFCVLDEGEQEPGEWWYYFNSVIAFGRIRRVTDETTMLHALRKLGNKYFPTAEEVEADIARSFSRMAVLELTIEHLCGKHVQEK